MISKPGLWLFCAIGLAAVLSAGAKAADPRVAVPQLAGITTDLGHNASALTYWVDEADGIHVVTTIDTVVDDETAPEDGRHAIVRFSAVVLPGQSQIISVPGPIGSAHRALRIRNLGDRFNATDIEIDRVAMPAEAVVRAHATN